MSGWIVPVKDDNTKYALNSSTFYITTESVTGVSDMLTSTCILTVVVTLQIFTGDLVTGDMSLAPVHLMATL